EIGLDDDQSDRYTDDQCDAKKRASIEVGGGVIVEIARQHQRREDLHELRWLKLKRPDVNPRLHVRGHSAPDEQVKQEQVPDRVKKRGDVEEDVIVDRQEYRHERDADRRPQHLFAKEVERWIAEIRRAVEQHTADRHDHQRGADEVNVDQRQRAGGGAGHQFSICSLKWDSYMSLARGAASVPPCCPACSTNTTSTICGLSTVA